MFARENSCTARVCIAPTMLVLVNEWRESHDLSAPCQTCVEHRPSPSPKTSKILSRGDALFSAGSASVSRSSEVARDRCKRSLADFGRSWSDCDKESLEISNARLRLQTLFPFFLVLLLTPAKLLVAVHLTEGRGKWWHRLLTAALSCTPSAMPRIRPFGNPAWIYWASFACQRGRRTTTLRTRCKASCLLWTTS